jgi:hypothetical protein
MVKSRFQKALKRYQYGLELFVVLLIVDKAACDLLGYALLHVVSVVEVFGYSFSYHLKPSLVQRSLALRIAQALEVPCTGRTHVKRPPKLCIG